MKREFKLTVTAAVIMFIVLGVLGYSYAQPRTPQKISSYVSKSGNSRDLLISSLGAPMIAKNNEMVWNIKVVVDITNDHLPPLGSVGYLYAYSVPTFDTDNPNNPNKVHWVITCKKLEEGPFDP